MAKRKLRKELIAAVSIPATILSVEGLKYAGHSVLGLSFDEVRRIALALALCLGAAIAIDALGFATRRSGNGRSHE